jgi:hypothetical protein
MTFREFNAKYLEPGSLVAMVVGVICLCQPWVAVLHQYSVLITLAGIIAFNVASHIAPPEPKKDEQHG